MGNDCDLVVPEREKGKNAKSWTDSDFMISHGLHGSLIQTAAAVVASTGINDSN
jgi:hypothetical protein